MCEGCVIPVDYRPTFKMGLDPSGIEPESPASQASVLAIGPRALVLKKLSAIFKTIGDFLEFLLTNFVLVVVRLPNEVRRVSLEPTCLSSET